MKNWIILSPEGTTYGPNDDLYENFQVLGFVSAMSAKESLGQLIKNQPYIASSGFDEVWIYSLENRIPLITYFTDDGNQTYPVTPYLNLEEKEQIEKIIKFLQEINAYSNISYDYSEGDLYYFEGYSDAYIEIKVEILDGMMRVYDRYITDKHFILLGEYYFS
jgi:hypothetical protein